MLSPIHGLDVSPLMNTSLPQQKVLGRARQLQSAQDANVMGTESGRGQDPGNPFGGNEGGDTKECGLGRLMAYGSCGTRILRWYWRCLLSPLPRGMREMPRGARDVPLPLQ